MANAVKVVHKLQSLHISVENVRWCSLCGEQYGGFLKNLNMELQYDPAISLLNTYSKELKVGIQIRVHQCS